MEGKPTYEDEPEPTIDPNALRTRDTRQFGHFHVNCHHNKVEMTVDAWKECEDCGKVKSVEKTVSTKRLRDFVPEDDE